MLVSAALRSLTRENPLFKKHLLIFFYVCGSMEGCAQRSEDNLWRMFSLCVLQGLNSDHQAEHQAPLLTDPSWQLGS